MTKTRGSPSWSIYFEFFRTAENILFNKQTTLVKFNALSSRSYVGPWFVISVSLLRHSSLRLRRLNWSLEFICYLVLVIWDLPTFR